MENHFRERAGQQGLGADGFIATYLTDVIYPADYLRVVQAGVAVVVAVSWAGFVVLRRQARRVNRS